MFWVALIEVSHALGTGRCWFYRGAFHFALDADWTVAVTPDSLGRVRVDTCHLGVVRDTKWCRDNDTSRLVSIVCESRDEVLIAL